ncbi:hypothetical protein GCM10010435_39140 [Winogradskya consettensis]|uniref:Uridine kinase n=1 Tax=Winogradskya consettensis TaxID=113560 RepID=A0A919T2C9_9ACTN|nr:uridylate kinase [Actinoplanes consettensis]GIM84711.1 hypothetical protein Aco04nite_92730 [Actinoplanes consettensis]
MNGTRSKLLDHLTRAVEGVTAPHPVRVAIDGAPAVGKTTLADELAVILRARGREVIRACIDDFLRPRSERYRNGKFSAEANYHDGFDFDALFGVLLDPLGPGGDRKVRTAVRDRLTDAELTPPVIAASADAVLLFDGVFLMRPELVDRWDLRVLVSADFEETLSRARTRDLAAYGSVDEVEQRFRRRYGPSQELYRARVHPAGHADIIIHNDDPQRPVWDGQDTPARS